MTVASGDGQSARINGDFTAPLSVLVKDSSGAPKAGVTVTFAAPGTGASAVLSPASAVTGSDGIATITATANGSGGSYIVTATAAGTAGVSFRLNNTVDTTVTLTLVAGDSQSSRANIAFATPLSVLVKDSSGNPKAGVAVTFTAPASGASFVLSTLGAVTGSDGIATVKGTANGIAGSYTVTATVPQAAAGVEFHLTNLALPVIAVVSGDGQSAVLGSAFAPLVVRVADTGGAPQSGVTVSFVAPSSGANAALSAATAVTGVDGTARVVAIANGVSGGYVVYATANGTTGTATFRLTNEGPASITVVEGDAQTALVSSTFPKSLRVVVLTASGKAMPGVVVTFASAASGVSATLSQSTVTTDANGLAAVQATANQTSGAHTVTASITGVAPAVFRLTNVDFNVTSSSNSLTVKRGQSASTAFSIGGLSGFTGTVALQCSSPLAGLTCSFAPATVTISGGSGTATLTVNAASNLADAGRALGVGSTLAVLLFAGNLGRARRKALLILLSLIAMVWVVGCGGGKAPGSSTPGTVDSQVTITATTGSITRTAVVPVKVE
jgi:hypothetical protein